MTETEMNVDELAEIRRWLQNLTDIQSRSDKREKFERLVAAFDALALRAEQTEAQWFTSESAEEMAGILAETEAREAALRRALERIRELPITVHLGDFVVEVREIARRALAAYPERGEKDA